MATGIEGNLGASTSCSANDVNPGDGTTVLTYDGMSCSLTITLPLIVWAAQARALRMAMQVRVFRGAVRPRACQPVHISSPRASLRMTICTHPCQVLSSRCSGSTRTCSPPSLMCTPSPCSGSPGSNPAVPRHHALRAPHNVRADPLHCQYISH